MSITLVSKQKCFGGYQERYLHTSEVLHCDMHFSVFLPPQIEQGKTLPVLYWLSGLTCSDENFVQKAGAQQMAAEKGIIIVAPDTSPRGAGVPDDENAAWDFGLGAGFYVNATQKPWSKHYQMYDYVVEELPKIIAQNFAVNGQQSIFGHSMGGHGALICALKNPGQYQSVSAFAPICNPSQVPWGHKALGHYLGSDEQLWQEYDACELLKKSKHHIPMLIDQGTEDSFLAEQLQPHKLQAVADEVKHPVLVRMQEGYDHSYFFIASFVAEHIEFHAKVFQK